LYARFLQIFNEQQKGKNKAEDSPRAMAKILKEANRVKEVLSANTETFAQIEGVFPDVDFKRTKVTRTELEEMCAHLFERAEEPMVDALKAAEITMVCHQIVSFWATDNVTVPPTM
jgi:hypoxia up-regulated 1